MLKIKLEDGGLRNNERLNDLCLMGFLGREVDWNQGGQLGNSGSLSGEREVSTMASAIRISESIFHISSPIFT